jgi:hypothetical protein
MRKNLVIKAKPVVSFYDDKCMKAKVFNVGDNVRVFVRKKSKLQRPKYSSFKVTQKINENAYMVDIHDYQADGALSR